MSRRFAGLAAALLITGALVALTPSVAAAAPVVDGNARFAVLTPTLIRMEYAGDGVFQNATTFTAVNRNLGAPAFTTRVTTDGYREIATSALTLRYRQGSGPFTAANLSVVLTGTGATAAPVFPSYCTFSAACEAENALLRPHAGTALDHTGFTGSGFVAGLEATGAGIEQDVSAVPSAGTYRLAVRYANAVGGDGQSTTRTLTVRVNGTAGPRLSLAPTGSWDTWSTAAVTVNLRAGANTVGIAQEAGDSGKVNLDSFAVTPASSTAYPGSGTTLLTTAYGAGPANSLGGWTRSLDNPPAVPVPQHPGLLDRGGWYLLDDTRTSVFGAGQVTARPSHGAQPYQDGYFFGYGTNYRTALADLNALTGPSALLPQSAYGIWFSRYFAYRQSDYAPLLDQFRNNLVPLDWLVVDTDWKSPTQWNGWNWNTALFPDPQGFLNWAGQQGLSVSLNIHPSISTSDPRYPAANSQAGGLPSEGGQAWFDWSKPAHLSAYLGLHRPFEQQGVRAWWLDACTSCGASTALDPHVGPDQLINQAYADEYRGRGVRGFSFARIGGAERAGIFTSNSTGPWAERRNTLQFTGDTPATWPMLGYEVKYTADEAAAGLSNVSHDIGSFHGGHLADDLYARWIQFGAFQPVDRMHSDHGDRLPWEYGTAANAAAQKFLRLREALVPYTYTLARQANLTGVPIVRPLYLNYPANEPAYQNPGEYLYGDNLLVAPITTPNDAAGNGSAAVWVPPGTWVDYFTGVRYTGPANVTISAPLSRMPVLIKAGGIVPSRTDYVQSTSAPLTRLTVDVAAGADGDFSLYQDAGEGTGYQSGQSSSTPISWRDGSRTLTVGAAAGTFPGAPSGRAYTLRLSNAGAPTAVTVDGVRVPETAWSYNADRRTVTVTTSTLPVGAAHTVTLSGTAAGNPASGVVVGAGGLCLDVRGGVAAEGQPVQLYGCNFTAAQQVSYGADNTVRVLGRCLTTAGTTATCTSGADQLWTRQTNGALVNPATGRCLDVPDGNTTPGAVQLRSYDCNGTAAQTWRLPPGPITAPAGLCADLVDAQSSSGTPVQLYGCNNSDAQRWHTLGDQTIRALGKCLDVRQGATANATAVQLWDCNGSAAQQWVSRPDGSLLNPQSGRCLDDAGGLQHSGDRLQIYDCNNTAAQRFRLG